MQICRSSFVSFLQVVVVRNKIVYYHKSSSALHSPPAVLLYCSQTLFIDCEHTHLYPLVAHIFSLHFLPCVHLTFFFFPFPSSLSTFPLQRCSLVASLDLVLFPFFIPLQTRSHP